MPSPVDALELPFMRTALVELVLLAIAGGLLGAWVVLRGLAFFTHAVGTATFPGLVAAHAIGVSPQLAGAATALAYAGGVERTTRAGRAPTEAATGLLLAAALALGALLASDVVDPGATPERLLFGTLLGLGGADVALAAVVAVLAVAGSAAAGRAWLALAFDPAAARTLGRRDEREQREVGGDRAARRRERPRAARARGRAGARGGRRRPLPRLVARRLPRAGDRRPRLGGVRRRRGRARGRAGARMSADLAVEARGLAAGYGRTPAIADVSFAVADGESVAVLGPNGGGKTTLFRALLGELPPLAGTMRLAGRAAYVPQTERTRLDFPVSALDVALMGTLARTAWWRPPRRSERTAARAALARVGLGDRAEARFGELSGGQRQRVLIARALVEDAPVLLLDEPLAGVDRAAAEEVHALFAALAGEGRTLLVSTHDVEGARRFGRVLCLNRRQVAFGAPGEVLVRDVLERTYGSEIVVLDDGPGPARAIAVQHHEH